MAHHSTPQANHLHKPPSEEIQLAINSRTLRGCVWNPGAESWALALHGWLDNASSFSEVARHLRNTRLVAIDLAGQGRSDPRSADAGYDLLDEIRDLYEVVEQMAGGAPVNLVGHSRGAVICNFFSAVFPERVNRAVLIDAIEPFPSQIEALPGSISKSILEAKKLLNGSASRYSDRHAALEARTRGVAPVSLRGADILAGRALEGNDRDGYYWRADQRLKGVSGFRITAEMREAFYARCTAPTLVIEPLQGMLRNDPRFAASGRYQANITPVQVPGGHHCHLEDCPERVAELIEEWLIAD